MLRLQAVNGQGTFNLHISNNELRLFYTRGIWWQFICAISLFILFKYGLHRSTFYIFSVSLFCICCFRINTHFYIMHTMHILFSDGHIFIFLTISLMFMIYSSGENLSSCNWLNFPSRINKVSLILIQKDWSNI